MAIRYQTMPAYQAAQELLRELVVIAGRMGPADDGVADALIETAGRTLLATAEAGARPDARGRELLYRFGQAGTHRRTRLLRAACSLGHYPTEATLSADAVIRNAQQKLTLAGGAMLERRRRQGD